MGKNVVVIQLDRPRELKFGHTALEMLEEITGMDVDGIGEAFHGNNYQLIAKMAYCGLLRDAIKHGETLTLESIPDLLDEAPSYMHEVEKIAEAWSIALSGPEGNQPEPVERPAKKAAESTGKKASE